jgi:hypothetical protein
MWSFANRFSGMSHRASVSAARSCRWARDTHNLLGGTASRTAALAIL